MILTNIKISYIITQIFPKYLVLHSVLLILGSRTITKSYAVDPQSKNTSKDDLQ